MTNVDVLTTQRQELDRCASKHEQLLKTLFGASLAFLSLNAEADGDPIESPATSDHGLSAFLDANDITQNRSFDVSTLPIHQCSRLPKNESGKPREICAQKQTDYSTDGAPNREDQPLPRQQNSRIPSEVKFQGRSKDEDLAPISNASTAHSSTKFSGPSNSSQTKSTNQASKENENGPEEAHKDPELWTARQGFAEAGKDWDDGDGEGQGPLVHASDQNKGNNSANNITSPDSGRIIHVSKEVDSEHSVSESQVRLVRKELYVPAPTSPNEQLRLEEAQAIHQPKGSGGQSSMRMSATTTGSDLPSQFIQDAFDDGNTMIDISSLNDDILSKQLTNGEHEQAIPIQNPTSAIRNPALAAINGETSKDLTFSRRPPMRIDTQIPSFSNTNTDNGAGEKPAVGSETVTPSKSAPLTSSAQSPPERMTTRVSSGALRHKSVSEILGETPKGQPTSSDKASSDANRDDSAALQTPKSASSFAASDPAAFKLRLGRLDDKDRSKLSTVVFAKQQSSVGSRGSEHSQSQQIDGEDKLIEPRDYFLTFFAAQAFTPPRAPPLSALLRSAHKTLGTTDHYTELREKQDFRILSQIKDMQAYGRWSLRQPERSEEPHRRVGHWDILLGHMKWMRTDFREERKFKFAGAKHLAESCAAWVAASPEHRQSLQINVRRTPMYSAPLSAAATPDLVNDETSEMTEDELPAVSPISGQPPAAIFSLPPDVFIFGLNKSPVADKLLSELPCYDPAQNAHDVALRIADTDPDAVWKTRLIPVSKYAQGKLIPHDEGPPCKKSRIEVSEALTSRLAQSQDNTSTTLPPLEEDVALFNPEHKHTRDRIHAGHAFRPPSEHQMPSRDFFECRSPSQWTMTEDDELRKLVREYAYNWSLISSCLSSPSIFSSGAERRTPWECFERWISLEGLPTEMSKVPYFRTYHQRLQQSARSYEARQQALIQQQGGNPTQLPQRRRSNQPFSVEKRKNNKPIHLIDAMRKHAKKKEATLHKQQQVASLAAMRKATEGPKERRQVYSAREYSRMKYERQMKIEEQHRLARHQYQSQAKKTAQQQVTQQINGMPQNRSVGAGVPNAHSPNMASGTTQLRGGGVDSTRAGPQMQRLINGQVTNGVVPTNAPSVPHAPMQPQMQMPIGQRLPPQMSSDVRLIQEAQRVQAEQQAFLQQRQQQRHPSQSGQGGSPNMQSLNSLPQSNATVLASMQGRSSPSINGTQPPPGTSSSPRINHSQPQSLSSGMTPAVNQIQNQVKIRHPGASPGEIQRLTTEQLVRMSQQQSIQQTAMAAAVGNSGGNIGNLPAPSPLMQQQQQQAIMSNGNASMFNQQQYAQYMRSQQASQQRSAGTGNTATSTVNGSRSATPLIQRTGSAQGSGPTRGPSQSPRPGSVVVASRQ